MKIIKCFILIGVGVVVFVIGLIYYGWICWCDVWMDVGFVSGNGCIEVIEIDVVIKLLGCVIVMFVDEGDFVSVG